jgi:uncharacterized membrane protein YdjX (TVP38/TMEM64 family)
MNEPKPRREPFRLFTLRKLLAVLFLAGLVFAYRYGPTEEELLSHQARWKASIDEDPWLPGAVFIAAAITIIGLSIPVPIVAGMMVLCGYHFGRWPALIIVLAGAPVGALLAMLASRYMFQRLVRRVAARRPRLEHWREAADRGIERDGWYYLLIMRLTPVIPFFVVNLIMGLTPIRIWTFYWVTVIGLAPIALVCVNAGASVRVLQSTSDLVSTQTVLALMLLVLFPIAIRALFPRTRTESDLDDAGF